MPKRTVTDPIPCVDWHGNVVELRPGWKMNAVTAMSYWKWRVLSDAERKALFTAIPRGRKAMRRVMYALGIRQPRFHRRVR